MPWLLDKTYCITHAVVKKLKSFLVTLLSSKNSSIDSYYF